MSASILPEPLNSNQLAYAQDGAVRVAYAPFDHIATSARFVVVGITPGLSQANAALRAAQKHLAKRLPLEDVLRLAKLTASFSGGAMRSNLAAMLDAIGVNQLFNLKSTALLFDPSAEHVHFTSALRYPVFVNGKNYNGTPGMLRTPILRALIETYLADEARLLPNALWLPLGPKAEVALHHLSSKGLLDRSCILSGLPHPSGANAERVAVFLGRKDPAAASRQTNPGPLLEAFKSLQSQIATLKGEKN
jgi:hypothetical protein